MLLKPNTIVVVLKGRFAGKKGVVVSANEDGRKIMVAGIEKMPQPITDDMSECKKRRLSRMGAFIRNYNSRHLLATRYRGDVGLSAIDFSTAFENFESKKMAIDAVKKAFVNANKQKKAAWLFEKLVF